MEQLVKANRDRIYCGRKTDGVCFGPAELRGFTAVGSELLKARDSILPFLSSMRNANMFRVAGGNMTDQTSDFLFKEAEALTSPVIAEQKLSDEYETPDILVQQIEILDDRIESARAIADFAVLEALDICAVLGGRELPTWPSNAAYCGSWIPKQPRSSPTGDSNYVLQARARKLERWGVPLWCGVPRREHIRLDATKDGGPVQHKTSSEKLHQRGLSDRRKKLSADAVHTVTIAGAFGSATRPVAPTGPTLPRDGELRTGIQDAIIALVDPAARQPLQYSEFDRIISQLLPPSIWSGKRYEGRQHGDIDFGSKEKSRWLTVRDGVHECGHVGALLAAFEIPRPWYDAQSFPADHTGVYAVSRPWQVNPDPSEPAVAKDLWRVVEVSGFQTDDREDVLGQAPAYRSRGVVGWRFVLSPVQNKDEQGRTIRHSRWQLEALVKTPRAAADVASYFQSTFPDMRVIQRTHEGVDMAWLNMWNLSCDPTYVAVLFSIPLPASRRRELLSLSPSHTVPASKIDGVPPEERARLDGLYLQELCHYDIFEYHGVFPPTVSTGSSFPTPSSTSTASFSSPHSNPVSQPAVATRMAKDMSQLSIDRFTSLAFAPEVPSLTQKEIIRFQRLALVLHACKRRGPFSSVLFPSDGAPYRRILHYVASVVVESSNTESFVFEPGEKRTRLGPWDETLKMTKDHNVQVFIDRQASFDTFSYARPGDLAKYHRQCSQEHVITRAEKRRRRKGRGKQSPLKVDDDVS